MIVTPLRPAHGRAVTLPLGYVVVAAGAFLLAALAVPWMADELAGHYFHPHVLALTHAVGLGWITLTIMGASYQLVPLVLERPIWSERLARCQLVLLVGGIVGMVAHFWIGHWAGLLWAVGVVGLGVALHLVNIGRTLWRGSPSGRAPWPFSARAFVLGLGGLGLTATLGLLLGANRLGRFLAIDPLAGVAAHFHLALLGWIAPMIVGVAARAYPMFLLAPEPGGWPGRVQLWGLGLGLPAVVGGLLVGLTMLVAPGAVMVTAAVLAHATWVVGMARGRKRPALDWGLRFVLTGLAYLGPGIGLGLGFAFGVLTGPRLALAYAIIALGGWVSLTIVGMMLKIVPFLVWYRVYAGRVGREPVPTLSRLAWPAMERLAYTLLATAPLGLAAAVATGSAPWIRAIGVLFAAGALAFGMTLARVLWHLFPGRARPRAAASVGARP